jgi:hypothetical protein
MSPLEREANKVGSGISRQIPLSSSNRRLALLRHALAKLKNLRKLCS